MVSADGIPVYAAHTEIVDIERVVPNPRNPNQHPDRQIELLAKIIKSQGWRAPITVSLRSGFVVRGHGRLMAARHLRLAHVPVDYQEYATEAEEWADLIADNRIAELAEMDNTMLKDLLEELDAGGIDMDLTGFDEGALANLMAQFHDPEKVREDDFDPDAAAAKIKIPVSRPGDIWALGRHRLMCGDATLLDDVERLLDGARADMVFTDPPYNVDYEGAAGKIQNDNQKGEDFLRFLTDAFTNLAAVLHLGGAIYICHADTEGENFRRAMRESGLSLKQCIVWAKSSFVLGRQDYQWRHESILYGWRPGAAHNWYGGRKQTTVIEDAVGLVIQKTAAGYTLNFTSGLQSLGLAVPSYEVLRQGDDSDTTVWRFEKPAKNGEHPTMKPIALVARAIVNSSKGGDLVLDTFGGSGSTLMAAEQIGRVAYLMELDPVFCDVIVQRWEEFTGQKAVRLDPAA